MINQVSIPQKSSRLGQFGSLAQGVGPLVSLIPGGQLAGAALTAGGVATNVLSSQGQSPSSAQGIDTMSSMRRRQNEQNPDQSIVDALGALDAMGLPDDQYLAYKAPLYAALNKNRGTV